MGTMSHAVTIWLSGLAEKQLTKTSLKQACLAKMLKRADIYPIKATDFEARACHLFHQKCVIPYAVSSAQVELTKADPRLFWLRVDPVQLIPDRDTLVLIPPSQLALTEQESLSLLDAFNQHFKQDGVELIYGSSSSWYLSVLQAVDIQTTSLSEASFKNLHGLFPRGHAAPHWRKLMNEAQMLFYTHPVNLARRERGEAEINSIWLWGEGALDMQKLVPRSQTKIWGQGTYLAGLAHLAQAQHANTPTDYQAWLAEADTNSDISQHLIVLDESKLDTGDQSLVKFEAAWAQGLINGIEQGKIHSLYLDLGVSEGFLIEPKHLKRFWRWVHPLSKLID